MTQQSNKAAASTAKAAHTKSLLPPYRPNTPPSRQAWLHFFDTSFLSIASTALVLALVFFIAYNWADMGKIGKFVLVELALALCVIGYAVLVYLRKFELLQKLLLLIASIITGSLLALVGQVYQTGADTWQLFLSWALLIIPFVLIARLPALWLLWLGLINLGTWLFIDASTMGFFTVFFPSIINLIALAIINFVAFNLWLLWFEDKRNSPTVAAAQESQPNSQPKSQLSQHTNYSIQKLSPEPSSELSQEDDAQLRTGHQAYHWSTYVIGIITIFFATHLGTESLVVSFDNIFGWISFAIWLVVMACLYWRFYKKQTDILFLTGFCSSIIIVVMVQCIDILNPSYDVSWLLLFSVLLIAMSSVAITWLLSLYKQKAAYPLQAKDLEAKNLEAKSSKETERLTLTEQSNLEAGILKDAIQTNTVQKACLEHHALITETADITPWYLQLFLATSGFFSGVLLCSFIALLLGFNSFDNLSGLITGIFLLTTSYVILIKNQPKQHAYLNSLALSLSMAGQIYLFLFIFDYLDNDTLSAAILMFTQILLALFAPNFLHRFISSLISLDCAVWLLDNANASELSAGLLALYASVFGLQHHEWLSYIRFSSTRPNSIHPNTTLATKAIKILLQPASVAEFFNAMALASMLSLLTISIVFISSQNSLSSMHYEPEFYYHYPLAQAVLIAVSLYAAYIILRRYGIKLVSKTGGLVALAIILLGIVSVYVSGLLASCLVIVIGFANQKRGIVALGTVALVSYIFWYYYQLDTSLLVKSASMLAVAVMMFFIHWVLVKLTRTTVINDQKPSYAKEIGL